MKTTAVILAGGIGLRMGGEQPKQFLEIEGKPILIHSLEAFQNHPMVDELLVVVNEKYLSHSEALLEKYNFSKLAMCIKGGNERMYSSMNALKHIVNNADDKVLLHDAVRPFVSEQIITNVIDALDTYWAVNVAISATDTILMVNTRREIEKIPPRDTMFLAQTPQGFRSNIIHRAYDMVSQAVDFKATDDCGVVHKFLPDIPIGIVIGDPGNRKITFPTDL